MKSKMVMMDGTDKIKALHTDVVLNIYTKCYRIEKHFFINIGIWLYMYVCVGLLLC